MKVYVVSCECQIPHHEYHANLNVFKSITEAEEFINSEYKKVNDSQGYGYITETTEHSAFDDCFKYMYSPDGYFICWDIEGFEVRGISGF